MPILVEVQRKRDRPNHLLLDTPWLIAGQFITLDDSVYCIVKQCNDCAEIWETCVDEDEEDL